MRVLHLSLFDRRGGACIAAYRQHVALQRHGVESCMLARFKVTNDPTVYKYTLSTSPVDRARRLLRRHLLQRTQRQAGLKGEFFDDRSDCVGGELAGGLDSDILNVQFSQGFLDHPSFYRSVPLRLPIVVTLHEMSPFTGGCSYAGKCSRFQERCGHCPILARPAEQDLSRQAWERRRAAYGQRFRGRLHFVADSRWLEGQARRSGLLAHYPLSVIHYGLDTTVFRPLDRRLARDVFQVPHGLPVVSFAAASVTDERKGMRFLLEALGGMKAKPFLLTWGRDLPPALAAIPHLHVGSIESEHLLALAYSAADVFVMPSLEEAFGQTALESIACGTPVAAFETGGITDIVRHEQTGLLSAVADSQQLSQAVSRILADRALWIRLSVKGQQIAAEEFSMELNARRYVELYRSLLEPNA